MRKSALLVFALFVSIALSAVHAAAESPDYPVIEGVLGITPVSGSSAFAVWVVLDAEEAISGFEWYNNDSSVVFPQVLAVAGEYGRPKPLADAVTLANSVVGLSQGWSSYTFSQPVTTGSPGLYLILRLEEGTDYSYAGLGGGSGVGYVSGTGPNNCWITADGVDWDRLDSSFQMAIRPIQNANKSAGVLRLNGAGSEDGIDIAPVGDCNIIVHSAPNPFNPVTVLSFELPTAQHTRMSVFDLRGRRVRNLVDAQLSAGSHSFTWDGRDYSGRLLASGQYLVRMEAGSLGSTTSITLMK